jgi:hypothetical protein
MYVAYRRCSASIQEIFDTRINCSIQFLKAGKIVKLFIILISMLLGKAYYDIQS